MIKLWVDLCLERRDHTEVGIVFCCIILFVILRDEMKSKVGFDPGYIPDRMRSKTVVPKCAHNGKCVKRVIDAHIA